MPFANSRLAGFIDTLSDERLQELPFVAIDGRGAFRRFKDVLARHPVEQEKYFKFRDERVRERITEWLNSLDVDPLRDPQSSS